MSQLISAHELAARLNVSPKSIYRWTSTGLIPALRVGGVLRYSIDEVARALTARAEGKEVQ